MLLDRAGPESGWPGSGEELPGHPLRNWSVTSPARPARWAPSQTAGPLLGETGGVLDWARAAPHSLLELLVLGMAPGCSLYPNCSPETTTLVSAQVTLGPFSLLGLKLWQ